MTEVDDVGVAEDEGVASDAAGTLGMSDSCLGEDALAAEYNWWEGVVLARSEGDRRRSPVGSDGREGRPAGSNSSAGLCSGSTTVADAASGDTAERALVDGNGREGRIGEGRLGTIVNLCAGCED